MELREDGSAVLTPMEYREYTRYKRRKEIEASMAARSGNYYRRYVNAQHFMQFLKNTQGFLYPGLVQNYKMMLASQGADDEIKEFEVFDQGGASQ